MPRPHHRLLLGLLCLLVLSWGTCPCVLARALKGAPEPSVEGAEKGAPVGCPCCEQHADAAQAEDSEKKPGLPEECPCCARGGANRDLPPSSGEIVIPPIPTDSELWFPELPRDTFVLPDEERWALEATGPPSDLALHGCPVGIVRLLN